jgi:hypothetical protein
LDILVDYSVGDLGLGVERNGAMGRGQKQSEELVCGPVDYQLSGNSADYLPEIFPEKSLKGCWPFGVCKRNGLREFGVSSAAGSNPWSLPASGT